MRGFLLLFLMLSLTRGAEVTITWGPVAEAARYHVYAVTNGLTKEFATVTASTNTAKFDIKIGIPHKFYVTAENINFIESLPSPMAKFTYPIGLPYPPYTSVRSSAVTTTNAWKDVNVTWSTQSESLAVQKFYLHFETGSTTNVYSLTTNRFVMKVLPFNTYKIYVQAENILGISPYRSNTVVNLSRANGKKILEEEK